MQARYCVGGAESLGDEQTAGVVARSSWGGGNIETWRHTFVLQCPTTRAASSTAGSRTPPRQRWAAPSQPSSGWWPPVRARRRSRDSWSSLPPGWGSPLSVGCRSPGEVGSAPSRRTTCSARWLLSRPRAGGFGTPWRGRGAETSTRWRSPPPASRSRSRRRRGRYDVSSSRSGARAGGVAGTTPAKVGTQRRPWRHVPRPCAGRRARRARRSRGLDRPVDARPSRRGRDGSTRGRSAG